MILEVLDIHFLKELDIILITQHIIRFLSIEPIIIIIRRLTLRLTFFPLVHFYQHVTISLFDDRFLVYQHFLFYFILFIIVSL